MNVHLLESSGLALRGLGFGHWFTGHRFGISQSIVYLEICAELPCGHSGIPDSGLLPYLLQVCADKDAQGRDVGCHRVWRGLAILRRRHPHQVPQRD
jgi:hypothetical protein